MCTASGRKYHRKMNSFGLGSRLIFVLWTVITATNGYNLDLTAENAKFMTSPVLQTLGRTSSGSRIPVLDPSVPPSFYGYQMNIIEPSVGATQPRLMIGAPKMTDPSNPRKQQKPTKPEKGKEAEFKPQGSVKACPIQKTVFGGDGNDPTCSAANPTPTQPGDAFGASVAASPNGKMSACSTARPQDCTFDKYNPGFCFNSKDYGAGWKMDKTAEDAACPTATVDVMFVLDGSESIGHNFKTVIDWVINIVRQLRNQMLTGYVQVGVVQYSYYFPDARPWPEQIYMKTEIALGKYKEFYEFKAAMRKITLLKYQTFTGKVLEKVVSDFTGSSRYKNKNNNQIMLLMTDGQSSDPDSVGPNAENLRNMGVTTFAVGVGNVNKTELKTIATGTESNKRVYSVNNFDGLDSLVNQLKTTILDMVLEGGDSAVNANYKTEFAQTGFSLAFEERDVGGRKHAVCASYGCARICVDFDAF